MSHPVSLHGHAVSLRLRYSRRDFYFRLRAVILQTSTPVNFFSLAHRKRLGRRNSHCGSRLRRQRKATHQYMLPLAGFQHPAVAMGRAKRLSWKKLVPKALYAITSLYPIRFIVAAITGVHPALFTASRRPRSSINPAHAALHLPVKAQFFQKQSSCSLGRAPEEAAVRHQFRGGASLQIVAHHAGSPSGNIHAIGSFQRCPLHQTNHIASAIFTDTASDFTALHLQGRHGRRHLKTAAGQNSHQSNPCQQAPALHAPASLVGSRQGHGRQHRSCFRRRPQRLPDGLLYQAAYCSSAKKGVPRRSLPHLPNHRAFRQA